MVSSQDLQDRAILGCWCYEFTKIWWSSWAGFCGVLVWRWLTLQIFLQLFSLSLSLSLLLHLVLSCVPTSVFSVNVVATWCKFYSSGICTQYWQDVTGHCVSVFLNPWCSSILCYTEHWVMTVTTSIAIVGGCWGVMMCVLDQMLLWQCGRGCQ